MAQIKKVEEQVEINCNADKLFDIWGRNPLEISKMSSIIPKVELVKGDNCHTSGSILSWTYIVPLGGKHEYLNTLLEDVDKEKRSLTYKLTEGEMKDKE